MPPKIFIQVGFVLVALLVFVIRAVWAAQQQRNEDDLFRGQSGGKRDDARPQRADPNSPWDDQRRMAAVEAERESLRDHSRGFSQRVAQDVDTSDVQSKLEADLHRKFDDRHVGTLDSGAASGTASVASTATSSSSPEMGGVWSNDPDRLRDAFVLREILMRPEQRWSETA